LLARIYDKAYEIKGSEKYWFKIFGKEEVGMESLVFKD